jgi:hypothetical protein
MLFEVQGRHTKGEHLEAGAIVWWHMHLSILGREAFDLELAPYHSRAVNPIPIKSRNLSLK